MSKDSMGFAAIYFLNLRYDRKQDDFVELKERSIVIRDYYDKYLKMYLKGLCGEHSGEAGEELFFALGALGGGLGELGAGEFLVHADGVPNEDAGDGHRGGEVFVVTEEGGAEFAGVVAAAGCEGHRNAEGDEAQAADAGYDIVTKEAVKFGLQGGVVVVEGMLLIRGELEFHLGHSFQVLIDVGEGPADVVEDFVEG